MHPGASTSTLRQTKVPDGHGIAHEPEADALKAKPPLVLSPPCVSPSTLFDPFTLILSNQWTSDEPNTYARYTHIHRINQSTKPLLPLQQHWFMKFKNFQLWAVYAGGHLICCRGLRVIQNMVQNGLWPSILKIPETKDLRTSPPPSLYLDTPLNTVHYITLWWRSRTAPLC